MKELKIDPELRDFIPPLSGEEKKQLEESLLKFGYKGAPIYTWRGFIVDGHNRYELCKRHNIDFPIDDLDLGDDATIIDVMEWMINTQLGRRNLPPAQRISVVDKFKKKIQEQAAMNKSDAIAESNKNRSSNVLQMEKNEISKKERIHTDKELAKMAGVGTGTIARYNRVMNSDDEELKKKVLSNEVKINTAYEKVRKKETENNNISNNTKPMTYQEAAQLYGGIQQGHLPSQRNKNEFKDDFTDKQLVDALVSTKTPVNVLDSIVPKQEFDIMTKTLMENIDSCDYRIFDLHEVCNKMENKDLDYAIEKFDSVIDAIIKLEDKIKKAVKGDI